MSIQLILAVALLVLAVALIFAGICLLASRHLLTRHLVAGVETQVSKYARLVVVKRAGVTSTVGIVLAYLVGQHVIPTSWAGGLTHLLNVGLDAVAYAITVSGVIWAHRGVTPADPALHPKDKYGNDLVSALASGPHPGVEPDAAAAAALAAASAVYPGGPVEPAGFMGGTAPAPVPPAA